LAAFQKHITTPPPVQNPYPIENYYGGVGGNCQTETQNRAGEPNESGGKFQKKKKQGLGREMDRGWNLEINKILRARLALERKENRKNQRIPGRREIGVECVQKTFWGRQGGPVWVQAVSES